MENSTTEMTLEQVQLHFQRFGLADYIVFATMLLGCSGIGLYYGLAGKKTEKSDEADEYLLGGRNMKVFPISMSLVASFISGVSLLGTPTELYLHGTTYFFTAIGIVMTGIVASYGVLPVFHELQLSSTYEYLRMRYDKRVQLFGSVLFSIGLICWMPIVIYAPALAFNQVTGVNVHIITPLVCLVCIFYTCVGGLKAVVWTDVVQTFLMFGAIFVIIFKGTYDAGGFQEVWNRNWEGGRLELPSLEPDITIRHSVMAVTIGMTIHFLQNGVVNQNMVQRYLCLPTVRDARIALFMFCGGCILITFICGYAGLLAYATFHDCDPLTTGLAKQNDQLLPVLVMQVLSHMPGMPGVFVAGVFSAALSSLSTGLNSMAAVVLEDFVRPNVKSPLSERATHFILRGVVVGFGILCVSLVFIVEKLGSVLQVMCPVTIQGGWATIWMVLNAFLGKGKKLSVSLSAVTCGATFGIFIGGMFLPWINTKGALWGGISGLAFSSILVIGYQRALAIGALAYTNHVTSVEGCDYTFPIANSTTAILSEAPETYTFFRMSYLYHTMFGGLFSLIASLLISLATGSNDFKRMDVRLFSPVIRPWLGTKQEMLLTQEDMTVLKPVFTDQNGKVLTNGEV